LENALNRALDAVQTLGPPDEKKTTASGEDEMAALPPELAKQTAENIKAAAEMGDVIEIKSIAEELKTQSVAFSPICDKLIQLADDFDFDGCLQFAAELEG